MQKRHVWPKLLQEVTTDEVVVITGPRQVGKTTTVRWLLEQIPSNNKYYFDLENIVDRELFEVKNYDSLINEFQNRGLSVQEKLYIALDEIQLLKNLPSVVKYLHDHYPIKFFLTGSSSYYIKNTFSESMAGRKIIYEMYPLSFQEFLDFQEFDYNLNDEFPWAVEFSDPAYQQLRTYYLEYVEFGGLPKVALTPDTNRKKQLLEEIFSSYINVDVQTLADFKSTTDLRKVIKLLAARVGSKLNVSELASITGLNRTTIDNYIEFLEQTYLIKTVPAYSKSIDVSTRLHKKPYFVDTGILTVNADVSSGSKFENTVRHQLSFWGKLQYYTTRHSEIDFILSNEQTVGAIEVKETPTKSDLELLERQALQLDISTCRIIGKEPSASLSSFLWGGFIK